jgi:hypothetical protein
MTHYYKRNGTTTLFAALNVLDGSAIGKNMQRLPQRHRGRGIGRHGRPRRPRQLRRPQAQSACLARPRSAFHLPLHAYLVLVTQRGRGLLRNTVEASPQARRFSFGRRPPGRHQPLPRRTKPAPQTVQLDRRPRQNHRRRQARTSSVKFDRYGQSPTLVPVSHRDETMGFDPNRQLPGTDAKVVGRKRSIWVSAVWDGLPTRSAPIEIDIGRYFLHTRLPIPSASRRTFGAPRTALSHCEIKILVRLPSRRFQAAAIASRHVVIAAARSTRCD